MLFFGAALFSSVLALAIIVLGGFAFFVTILGAIAGLSTKLFGGSNNDVTAVWTVTTTILVIIGVILFFTVIL